MNRDTVTPGQIVMHPNGRGSFLLVAVVILPTLLMLLAFPTNLSVVATVVLILLATRLPGLYWYTTQVIVDVARQTVQCKTALRSKTYRFAEVYGVQKVNALNGLNYYVLTTTADPYGQGIRLSDRSVLVRKASAQFEQTVLPALTAMLSKAGVTKGTTVTPGDKKNGQ